MHDNNSISFQVSPEDAHYIGEIVKRVERFYRFHAPRNAPINVVSIFMDLAACHANACPLDFKRMANADDFNLLHDVCGIGVHLDRETGKLTDCFLPRFARLHS